jgi:hypothetical protein
MSEELRKELYEEYKLIKEEYGAYAADEYAENCGADFTDLIEAEKQVVWEYPF